MPKPLVQVEALSKVDAVTEERDALLSRLSSSMADREIAAEEARCCLRDAESLRGLLGEAEERLGVLEEEMVGVSGERDALSATVCESRAENEGLMRELGEVRCERDALSASVCESERRRAEEGTAWEAARSGLEALVSGLEEKVESMEREREEVEGGLRVLVEEARSREGELRSEIEAGLRGREEEARVLRDRVGKLEKELREVRFDGSKDGANPDL